MEIILTVLDGQSSPVEILQFPMLPEEIQVKTGQLFASYTIMKTGTIKIPSGRDLTGFSWDGILPGEIRKNAPYVSNWRDPKQLQSLWSVYERDGIKLRLMVTETPINHDVYIESYNVSYKNGQGDYSYTINFLHAIDIKVYTSGTEGNSTSTAATLANKPQGVERTAPPGTKSYIVVTGDSLYKIAEKMLGAGNKYEELYQINKGVIDEGNRDPETGEQNPDYVMIHPGQELFIPNPAPQAPPKPAPIKKAEAHAEAKADVKTGSAWARRWRATQ